MQAEEGVSPVVQQALGPAPVPARPARLLVVVVHALGQAVVDHEADICLVDAHAKSHCGNNDLNVPCTDKACVSPGQTLHAGDRGFDAAFP